MPASPLTTHALDTSTGLPAAGLALNLYFQAEPDSPHPDTLLASAACNHNGRVPDLLPDPARWRRGTYRIRFFTQQYFAQHRKQCFYPHCDVTFVVSDLSSHYHVPLIISPFAYSTYRGS